MSNYKYYFGNGHMFGDKKDAEILEKRAAKGYMAVGINKLGAFRLEKTTPQEVAFSADFRTIEVNSPDFADYCAYFERAGWTYAFSNANFAHFFKAPKGTPPIYSNKQDEKTKYKAILSLIVPDFIMLIVFSVVSGLLFYFLRAQEPFNYIFLIITGWFAGLSLMFLIGCLINVYRSRK